MRRRLFWLAMVSGLSFVVLIGRLFLLTVVPACLDVFKHTQWVHRSHTHAQLEHLSLLQTDDGRGRILYRNGAPWRTNWRSVAFGPRTEGLTVKVHQESLGNDPATGLIGQIGLPDQWPGKRSVPEQGRSGLEYRFDDVLQGHRPGYIGILRDAAGRLYPSHIVSMPPESGLDVRTTIDAKWEQVAKQALAHAQTAVGAVVIEDVPTGDILAAANTDKRHPFGTPAFKSQVPGSIFKIVTSAAAMDAFLYRPQTEFYCNGRVEIPGVDMRCWTIHGRETLIDAIAQSCDVAFAQIGTRLGGQALVQMSRQLGLTTDGLQVIDGKSVFPGADKGQVFKHAGSQDAGTLANTAIGQQDVRMSPLQAANLARTVAHNGRYSEAKLILDFELKRQPLAVFSSHTARAAMSGWTAAQIAGGMRRAVVLPTGTAHALAGLGVSCAVKTGTAELGTSGKVNTWMIGFAPYRHPQIAFAVFVGTSPTGPAHHAVTTATSELLQAYRQFSPSADIS